MMNKDESIVSQVAAKIASELTNKDQGPDNVLSEWATAYTFVQEKLFESMGFGATTAAAPAQTYATVDQAVQGVERAFGYTEPSYEQPQQQYASAPAGPLRVKGDSFGPLPEWLYADAAKAGVTEVYDNRNQLAENPKRPHFRGTSGKDAPAFWPPKGR